MEGDEKEVNGAAPSQGGTDSVRTAKRSTPGAGQAPAVPQEGYSLVQAVFEIPELLEIILNYTIHDKNVEQSLKTLRAVRLVNKSWLTGVTNLMRRIKEPLFKLRLTGDNSLNGALGVEVQGKLLDVFATTIGNRIEKPFPTFSLKMDKEFFRCENFHSLMAFLRQCAEGLLELEMIIPQNGGSLPGGMLSIVDLPMLQNMVVGIPNQKVDANLSGNELQIGHATNINCLIQSFLSKAPFLQNLLIPCFGPTNLTFYAPVGFQFITLPESITNLELRCLMRSNQLKMLVTNKLPNLMNLLLTLANVIYSDGLISEVLNNFSEHLRNLVISGVFYTGPPRITNFVRFPVMKELTSLTISSANFELEAQHPLLTECFPKLHVLNLCYLTKEMLRKWTTGVPMMSVDDLSLSLIDENKATNSSGSILPLKLKVMQGMHLTFPNISKLSLVMSSGTQACGLKYLFMEMRQLTNLSIDVRDSEFIINSNFWDSVFTGAPVSVVASLQENPDFWCHFEVKNSAPSIKMLTELRSLTLEAVVKGAETQAANPLISDMTFAFSLLKMPKLMNLNFYGRFSVTSAMTETWKKKGGILKYSALPR